MQYRARYESINHPIREHGLKIFCFAEVVLRICESVNAPISSLDKTNACCLFHCLQARIAKELIELRNKSVFAFFMFNALFVLVVFLLQLNKDQIHVKWPLGIRTNITYIEETSEV